MDLNFTNALSQVRSGSKDSFFYQTMGLTNKTKFATETTAQIKSSHRFELNHVCDVNYQFEPALDAETKLTSSKFMGSSISLNRRLVNKFEAGPARNELTMPWKYEVTNTNSATTTNIGSLAIGAKFKQTGGFKLIATGELVFETNFKMIGETNKTETNKTMTSVLLPSMQIGVPENKAIYVTVSIEQMTFNGTFVNRYPIKNAYATAVINKTMSTNCNDANYIVNISDLLSFDNLKNTTIFNASESNNIIYVEDKFSFETNAGYKLLVEVLDQDPAKLNNILKGTKTDNQSHVLFSKIILPSDIQKGLPLLLNESSTIKSNRKNEQTNPFVNTTK